MTPDPRHVITVTDVNTCGTCGHPVGWTAFRVKGHVEGDPYSGVKAFLRHYRDAATARRRSSRVP